MQITKNSIRGIIEQLQAPEPALRLTRDGPYDALAIAAADNARFLALGCYTSSPVAARKADVIELIREVHAYSQRNPLPVGATTALGAAAAIMGIELS